jgi:hypothetical protein
MPRSTDLLFACRSLTHAPAASAVPLTSDACLLKNGGTPLPRSVRTLLRNSLCDRHKGIFQAFGFSLELTDFVSTTNHATQQLGASRFVSVELE